jgi:hypothetical protein
LFVPASFCNSVVPAEFVTCNGSANYAEHKQGQRGGVEMAWIFGGRVNKADAGRAPPPPYPQQQQHRDDLSEVRPWSVLETMGVSRRSSCNRREATA